MVTGYEYVRELFTDPRLGRSHPEPENADQVTNFALIGAPTSDHEKELQEHARMRRMLTPALNARRIGLLEHHVQELVDAMLDHMAALPPPVDMHTTFSSPLSMQVICGLLGVPFADHAELDAWAYDFGNVYDRELSAAAHEKLMGYMRRLVAAKRELPGEDLISDLLAAEKERPLTDDEATRLAMILLFAGHETTVSYIDLGTVFLLVNPDHKKALMDDDSNVVGAVEEILRIVALGSTELPRYAQEPIEIGGVTIMTGDAVLLAPNVANRDPSAFPHPDRMDINRETNQHLSFGYGIHHCPGHNLARLELKVVFRTLFRRLPRLELAVPVEQLEVDRTHMIERLIRLPVTW